MNNPSSNAMSCKVVVLGESGKSLSLTLKASGRPVLSLDISTTLFPITTCRQQAQVLLRRQCILRTMTEI